MQITYSNTNHSTRLHAEGTPYLTFPMFSAFDWIRHGFSTRLGGVSEGIYASMNLSFTRGDCRPSVEENFRRIGSALQIPVEDMVMSDQTHTTNILYVDDSHRGMGILRDRDFHDIDGLITDVPGVCLVTSYADCVPLFFVDPVHHAIATSHSGWRGTVHNITQNTVTAMQTRFGTNPSDLVAFIGPSICGHCYEVSEDVAEEFAQAYGPEVFHGILTNEWSHPMDGSTPTPIPGKYLLNLWRANEINMLRAGIRPENIGITDLCTCCNPTLLHSHRASKGQRGGLCGFMEII